MRSEPLEHLLAELEEDSPLAETYSLSLWEALPPQERDVAEQALLDQVHATHNPRAVMTLAAIGSPRARQALEPLAARGGFMGVWARRALLRMSGSREDAARLALDVGGASTFLERFAAVTELGHHLSPEVAATLDAALEDRDAIVRRQALDTLIQWMGLETWIRSPGGASLLRSPLKVLGVRLTIELESVWRPTSERLRWIFTRLESGTSAEALDLAYHPTEAPDFGALVSEALADPDLPLPSERILASTGHDRAWVETLLLAALEPGREDARALPLLKAMAPDGLEQILEEAGRLARSPSFRRQVEQSRS